MDFEIKASELGHGSQEGTFTVWLKAPGDPVRAGDPIAEVMTEKANVELVSPADGVLHTQLVQANDTFTQETILGIVRTS